MPTSFLYVAFMIFYSTLHSIFGLFKTLHVLILLKEKLMPSLVIHSVRHMDFLLIEQVVTRPLYVYFSYSYRGARPSTTH